MFQTGARFGGVRGPALFLLRGRAWRDQQRADKKSQACEMTATAYAQHGRLERKRHNYVSQAVLPVPSD